MLLNLGLVHFKVRLHLGYQTLFDCFDVFTLVKSFHDFLVELTDRYQLLFEDFVIEALAEGLSFLLLVT